MTIFKQKDNKKGKTNVTKLGANWNNGLNTSAFYWNLLIVIGISAVS